MRKLIPLFFIFVLTGCQTPKMETPTDYVAASYSTITALANTVKTHYQAGIITDSERKRYVEDLKNLLSMTDIARGQIDIGDNKTALEILRTVNLALLKLQKELEARQ